MSFLVLLLRHYYIEQSVKNSPFKRNILRAIKVEYTVKSTYVSTNKANIQKVMEELRALGDVGVLYSSNLKEDGCSFEHFSIHKDAEEPNIITKFPAFKTFSTQLKIEGLLTQPQVIKLDMIGKSFDL